MSDEKKKNIIREFKLSSLSIDNRISVYVLILIIFLMGLLSYNTMPKEAFPEVVQPTIYVNTPYPGNSPIDMENLVTRPIEKEIKSLTGIKKMTSSSIQDFSIIIVEFDLDVDADMALQDVKDAVDKAKSELPNDLPTDPDIFKIDFSQMPVMYVNLSGDYTYDELKEYAEYLQDEFENLVEVSEVDISGLLEKEVEISVDLYKMQASKISLQDIENAVAGENITISGGDILSVTGDGMNRRSIRVSGEFTDYKQIENIIIKDEDQDIVYLRDVAEVHFGPVEPTSFARLDGNKVVTLQIKKKSGENLLIAADEVRSILDEAIGAALPEDIKVVITNDMSKETRNTVNNLENSIISGVILVVLVLLFFLGTRNAMFVGVAIPLSMLMGIAILNFSGTTMNMMVLYALILALGMLVDNGIVVVENIYRLHQNGKDKDTSSKEGVGEVAIPIIASTATTLAAFLPLLFWNDLMGEFMKYIPITLIIVLSSSLFVGLVVNPVLTATFMKLESNDPESAKKKRKFWIYNGILLLLGVLFIIGGSVSFGNLLVLAFILRSLNKYAFKPWAAKFQSGALVKIENFYERAIAGALKGYRPIVIFVSMFVLVFVSMGFFGSSGVKFLFFPNTMPQYVNVFIETPIGTDINETDSLTREIETAINRAIKPNMPVVEAVLAQVGEGTADPAAGPQPGSSPNKARITVSFHEYEKRVRIRDTIDGISETSQIMKDIRQACDTFPNAIVTVEKQQDGPPTGKPINLEIIGEDFDSLIAISARVKQIMENEDLKGVEKLQTDLEVNKPELVLEIDREAARRYGVSTSSIGFAIRTALFGKEISKYKEGEDDYEINLRLMNKYRYNLTTLLNMPVTFRNQTTGKIVQVPISAVTHAKYGSTYGAVNRRDLDRIVNIYSNVEEGANANELVGKYKELLADYELPEGYEMKFTGEQEEQNKSTEFLGNAFLIAMLLIFLIIVSQFNSILSPAIIMFAILFSTVGVFVGFGIFKMDFVILMCGIGIISLAGVVVNNAIVLIDYTNLVRQRRKNELNLSDTEFLPYDELLKVIIEGGKTRLRPVLLTAITTVLGLIPLALGININFFTLFSEYDPQFYMGGDSTVFWAPMSWTIIFGLTFATFLTLIVVPVMYLIVDRITYHSRRILAKM